MRILTFTSLYPNAAQPSHGIFVETRLRHLLASGKVESRVVAPVPWFPLRHRWFGEYAAFAAVPSEERRLGIEVLHPRYPVIPKVGMTVAPFLLAGAVRPAVERLFERSRFDLIDAHYFYPDGIAAIILGKRLGTPVVITARGTDLNLIPRYPVPRAMIRWAARHAAGMITVCEALKKDLVGLGVAAERVEVLRNGVDLDLFAPVDRDVVRRDLGFSRTTLISVGGLVPRKAHDLVIKALHGLPEVELIIVGNGRERENLIALARETGVHDRVRFVPALPQAELRRYYGAADILVLASSREGWANVLLEAMACGTPVVATDVGGTSEFVNVPEAGIVVEERTPEAIRRAVLELRASNPDRNATRRYAEQFSWSATTEGQLKLFSRVLSAAPGSMDIRARGVA